MADGDEKSDEELDEIFGWDKQPNDPYERIENLLRQQVRQLEKVNNNLGLISGMLITVLIILTYPYW